MLAVLTAAYSKNDIDLLTVHTVAKVNNIASGLFYKKLLFPYNIVDTKSTSKFSVLDAKTVYEIYCM